jgi:asparaginyl-tRNA synthetase
VSGFFFGRKGIQMTDKIILTVENKKVSLTFNKHFGYLAAINQSLNLGASSSYQQRGLTYVDVPEIVGITGACENVDTLFKVGNNSGLPLFFTQTGQLALEQSLQSFSGVYTVIHSGRDETKEDDRHLRQFRLTEEEFDCTTLGLARTNYNEEKMFTALLANIQQTVQAMVARALKDNANILKTKYKRDIKKLEQAAKKDFWRIGYREAIKLLNKNGYPKIKFGDDLEAEHEARVVALLNRGHRQLPVFICQYPKEIKFFNMKVSTKDPQVVLSADLVFPYAGEGCGSAVREHEYARLHQRLLTSTMYKLHIQRGGKYSDFGWYLQIIKQKSTQPHAGYGIGNERVLQYILGLKDIRQASLFTLLNRQTGDWDREKYGQSVLFNAPAKHILLSIGQKTNKQFLLPFIRQLVARDNVILHATEKTHAFLQQEHIHSQLVYKISQVNQEPNIATLLKRRVFDLIINIPTRPVKKLAVRQASREFTDGHLIRKNSAEFGISLITDTTMAAALLKNLSKP